MPRPSVGREGPNPPVREVRNSSSVYMLDNINHTIHSLICTCIAGIPPGKSDASGGI